MLQLNLLAIWQAGEFFQLTGLFHVAISIKYLNLELFIILIIRLKYRIAQYGEIAYSLWVGWTTYSE
jgi:hypothetical protein